MKKIVGILSILGLTFLGFTNAGLQEFDLGVNESITANTSLGYDLRLNENANFLTNDLYKVVQFKGNGNYPRTWSFFWNGNGMYVIDYLENQIQIQGFMQYVNIVDYDSINFEYQVAPGFTPIEDFLTNADYKNPDKLLLGGNGSMQNMSLCFVYSDINKAVCFAYNDAITCSGYPQYCTNGVNKYITNSLNLNTIDITELAQVATVSPLTSVPTPTPTTNFTCPTIQQLINTYGNEYNTGLCYSSSLIYSGGTIETITPKTIFELYPTYTGYMKDINLYNNYCVGPNTITACQTAFNNKNIEYTLISKTTQTNRTNLYGYCNLQLNYEDKNATTCVTTGTQINDHITIEDIMNEITEEDREVISPGTPPKSEGTGNDTGSGSVFDSLGIGNEEDGEARRNVIAKAQNAIKSMKSIYTKLTGIFRARTGQNGIIPEYITGLLLLIVLFKLFKK